MCMYINISLPSLVRTTWQDFKPDSIMWKSWLKHVVHFKESETQRKYNYGNSLMKRAEFGHNVKSSNFKLWETQIVCSEQCRISILTCIINSF